MKQLLPPLVITALFVVGVGAYFWTGAPVKGVPAEVAAYRPLFEMDKRSMSWSIGVDVEQWEVTHDQFSPAHPGGRTQYWLQEYLIEGVPPNTSGTLSLHFWNEELHTLRWFVDSNLASQPLASVLQSPDMVKAKDRLWRYRWLIRDGRLLYFDIEHRGREADMYAWITHFS